MDKKKILLFGGTFNPIHNGHLIVARHMAEKIGVDKIVLVPNGKSPLKNNVIPKNHRYEMLKLAVLAGENNDPLFDISTYELEKLTPSFTLETIRYFKRTLKDTIDKPYFMVGPDKLKELVNWYKIDELVKECVFVVGISALTTDAFHMLATYKSLFPNMEVETVIIPHIDIRSTEIRERVKDGLSIRNYVPNTVVEYIRDNGIYTNNKQLTAI